MYNILYQTIWLLETVQVQKMIIQKPQKYIHHVDIHSPSLDIHSATFHLIKDLRNGFHISHPGCGGDPRHRQMSIQATVLQGFLIYLGCLAAWSLHWDLDPFINGSSIKCSILDPLQMV